MTEVKRMHYVPRCLLERFANSNGQIWVYDKREKNWFCTNPINAAVEKGMYSQEVEQWFGASVERPASTIFRNLSNGKSRLTEDEMLVIANFISEQMMRVPFVRDSVVERYESPGSTALHELVLEEAEKFHLMEKLSDFSLSLTHRKELQRLVELSKSDLQSFLDEIDWQQGSFVKMLEARMHDEIIHNGVSFFMRLAWRIIYADKGRYVLSDKPVEVWNLTKVGGTDNPTFECVLPVSTKCAIHIGRYGQAGVVNEVLTQDRLVKRLNARVVSHAYRFIYSAQEEKWVEKSAYSRTRLPHIRFDGRLIPARYGRSPCPNCGEEYTQAEWDSSEISHEVTKEDGKYTLNSVRTISHSCSA